MRQPAIRLVLLVVMALLAGTAHERGAAADPRADAKAHYQAGVKAYTAADYRTAIKEFSAAQQIAPADLNNYNLALCYDKLGEAEPAIQYYKEYIARVPSSDKRAEIEASVARLEGALQSAAAKRADEAKRAEDAKRADDAKRAEEARKATPPVDTTNPGAGAAGAGAAGAGAAGAGAAGAGAAGAAGPGTTGTGMTGDSASVGSSGTPGTGTIVSTGDAQLDRASAIDIDAIRQQRMGMGTNDAPVGTGAGAAAGVGAQAGAGVQGAPAGAGAGAQPGQAANTPRTEPAAPADQPKQPTPVYKKWWFWAVVVVSVFVVYQIATTDSKPTNMARTSTLLSSPGAQPDSGGLTLWKF